MQGSGRVYALTVYTVVQYLSSVSWTTHLYHWASRLAACGLFMCRSTNFGRPKAINSQVVHAPTRTLSGQRLIIGLHVIVRRA
jgi:hypothetical protein